MKLSLVFAAVLAWVLHRKRPQVPASRVDFSGYGGGAVTGRSEYL